MIYFLNILLFLIKIIVLYQGLYIFQQTHYEYGKFFRWIRNAFFTRIIPLILLTLFYRNIVYTFIIFLYFLLSTFLFRKRLVITKRLIRILVVTFLLSFPIKHHLFLLDFIIMFSCFLLKPIEKIIEEYYVNKSKTILSNFKGTKIGITGSYGKTSTKFFLGNLIKNNCLVTPKSYNTIQGISKTINTELNYFYDYFILEMGASKINDISKLSDYIEPDIVIITNIGEQHLETFKSIENIVNEKFQIIEKLSYGRVAFINADDKNIMSYKIKNKKAKIITYGIDNGDYRAIINKEENYFDIYYESTFITSIPITIKGEHNIYNILVSIAVCDYLNIPYYIDNIKEVKKRMSINEYKTFTLIDDSFNSNIKGSMNALKELGKYTSYTKYVITPGYVELSYLKKKHHYLLANELNKYADFVILIGRKRTGDIRKYLVIPYKTFPNFKLAYAYFLKKKQFKDVLLIENDIPDCYYGGLR